MCELHQLSLEELIAVRHVWRMPIRIARQAHERTHAALIAFELAVIGLDGTQSHRVADLHAAKFRAPLVKAR